ncbi:MAG: PilZ domain-containing protein [Gammaproteobacteria bacterium]|nr:PilZ domain-containing protein [Gammaproteobacteria bacterium]MBU2155527.1 PilZ domain-containing protein [Gammaproteobacteria bacterium]MBU2257469.1 PilZ domain-containing protein [Gammaproteobacteria bacterium]
MRHFLRHPSDMPVELVVRNQACVPKQRLNNISLGGVACNSKRAFRRGTAVEMRIPLFGEHACYPGVVAWCCKQEGQYLVGIAFVDEDTLFRARMVEQVCQIEHYRHQREQELGCSLTVEAVAQEWISQHAAEFSRASLS